ncbi:hypothetical protein [Caulobacter sp. NIBR2454]|uniref:hypothetical protein n=1 Tax=Caulobacter sp. NIBR2454 TaxID=3015996 RepID=UPI0022B64617|nr:hypothetical protein [Caulobacter sp. NIBR2454]
MATERVTETEDGVVRERVVERGGGTTVIERRGGGMGTALLAIAVIAVVALAGYFLVNQNRRENAETAAIGQVADSASGAAKSVGNAADAAADAVRKD